MRYPDKTRKLVEHLYKQGCGARQIGAMLGIPATTIYRWTHPDYNQRSLAIGRRYKERQRRRCATCGASIWMSSTLCFRCAKQKQKDEKRWTREAIIQAIQQWADKHGQPPVVSEWRKAGPDHPGFTSCYGPGSPFPNWADAIEAAGYPRPRSGHKRKDKQWDHERARQLRDEGWSNLAIARALEVHPTTISNHLGPVGERTTPLKRLYPYKRQPPKDLRRRNREQRIADLRKALDADPTTTSP